MNIFDNIRELKAIYNGDNYKRTAKLTPRKRNPDFSFLDVITHIVGLAVGGIIYCRNMVFEMLEHIYDIMVGLVELVPKLYRHHYGIPEPPKFKRSKFTGVTCKEAVAAARETEATTSKNRYDNVRAEGEKKPPANKKEAYKQKKLELRKYMRR